MSIDFQAPVESAYVNSKLMSRTSDTSTTGKVDFLNSTQSNDINTGAVIVTGGAAVKKNLNVGQNAAVAGTISSTGNITTAADFYALNAYITNQLTAIQVLADFITGDSVTGDNVNANIALLASQKVSFSPQVDAALTGGGAVLTGIASKNIVFLTNALLTDISEIEAGTSGQLLILNNKTGATIIINHLTGTAGNQIDTGSGGASEMLDGSSIWLYYNTTNAVWNVIGGSGGGAKKDLSNLEPTAINESLIPNTDDLYDIGADGTSWATVYATTFAKDANNFMSLGSGQWVYNSVLKIDVSTAGEVNFNTSKIKNVVDPSAAQDAATKNYVDTNSIFKSVVTTKGDLIAATASATVERLPVGVNGQVLTADSAETTGLKWTSVAGSALAVTTKTTTYTAATSDDVILVTTGSSWTLTLYAASGNSGKILTIKKTSSDLNVLTIDGNASETIDGATSATIKLQYETIRIICDGSNWIVLGHDIPTVASRYTSNSGQLLEAAGGGEIMIFEDGDYDTHSSYNTSTGVFTALITGFYSVCCGIALQDAAWTDGDSIILDIRKNSSTVSRSRHEVSASNTVIESIYINDSIYLTAGQTLDLFFDHNRTGGNVNSSTTSADNFLSIKRIGL